LKRDLGAFVFIHACNHIQEAARETNTPFEVLRTYTPRADHFKGATPRQRIFLAVQGERFIAAQAL